MCRGRGRWEARLIFTARRSSSPDERGCLCTRSGGRRRGAPPRTLGGGAGGAPPWGGGAPPSRRRSARTGRGLRMRGGPPRSLSQPRSLSRRRRLLCDRRAEPGPAPRAVSGADGAEAPFCAAAGGGLERLWREGGGGDTGSDYNYSNNNSSSGRGYSCCSGLASPFAQPRGQDSADMSDVEENNFEGRVSGRPYPGRAERRWPDPGKVGGGALPPARWGWGQRSLSLKWLLQAPESWLGRGRLTSLSFPCLPPFFCRPGAEELAQRGAELRCLNPHTLPSLVTSLCPHPPPSGYGPWAVVPRVRLHPASSGFFFKNRA